MTEAVARARRAVDETPLSDTFLLLEKLRSLAEMQQAAEMLTYRDTIRS